MSIRPLLIATLAVVSLGALVGAPSHAFAAADEEGSTCETADDPEAECQPEPEPEPVPQQVSLADLRSPSPAATDLDMKAALGAVGFLDTWYASTPTHPRLSIVQVSGRAADQARSDLLSLVDDLIEAREITTVLVNATQNALGQRAAVELDIEAINYDISVLRSQRAAAEQTLAELRSDLADVTTAIQQAAISMYVSDTKVGVGSMDDVENYNDQREMAVQVDVTLEELLSQRERLEALIAEQEARIEGLDGSIDRKLDDQGVLEDRETTLHDTINRLTDQVTKVTTRRLGLEADMPGAITEAHDSRLMALAPGIGVSLVTLDAYVKAAEGAKTYYPDCRIRWELIAGIARVESGHGTFGRAWVSTDGRVRGTRILGPVLDGTVEDTAIIEDTDGGTLDGNSKFDAAVGPLQFLPQTWRAYRLDGNGDGWADPHNMYDASLSAAGYLCASSRLANDGEIRRSVLTYNNSLKYLATVTGAARAYILTLALPEAAYDPDTVDARAGWSIHFGDSDPYERLGQLSPLPSVDEPETLAVTGRS